MVGIGKEMTQVLNIEENPLIIMNSQVDMSSHSTHTCQHKTRV